MRASLSELRCQILDAIQQPVNLPDSFHAIRANGFDPCIDILLINND